MNFKIPRCVCITSQIPLNPQTIPYPGIKLTPQVRLSHAVPCHPRMSVTPLPSVRRIEDRGCSKGTVVVITETEVTLRILRNRRPAESRRDFGGYNALIWQCGGLITTRVPPQRIPNFLGTCLSAPEQQSRAALVSDEADSHKACVPAGCHVRRRGNVQQRRESDTHWLSWRVIRISHVSRRMGTCRWLP